MEGCYAESHEWLMLLCDIVLIFVHRALYVSCEPGTPPISRGTKHTAERDSESGMIVSPAALMGRRTSAATETYYTVTSILVAGIRSP